MKFHQKRLITALLAVGLPAASAWAQGTPVIVPPPIAPGAPAKSTPVAPSRAPVNAPASAAAPVAAPSAAVPPVMPPTATASVQPGADAAAAPMTPVLQVAIPEAPKPDLKPAAPVAKKLPAKPSRPVVKKPSDPSEDTGVVVKRDTAAADPFVGIVGTPVSASQINRFVFPEPVEGIFFQEGAPLPECPDNASAMDPCKPVFLNGKRVMLLQLRAGAKGPIQMVVHLKSGRFETLNLMPAAGPGAVIRLEGAEDGASDTRLAEASKTPAARPDAARAGGLTATEQNVELLARFARGDIPAGFAPVAVPSAPVRFDLFDVLEQASWDNGSGLKVHLYQIKAHGTAPVAISTSLFRHENVKALALDRETITSQEPALLYMLELVPTEIQ